MFYSYDSAITREWSRLWRMRHRHASIHQHVPIRFFLHTTVPDLPFIRWLLASRSWLPQLDDFLPKALFCLPATLLAWDPFRFWVPTWCSRYLALKPMWNCMRFAWATIVHIEDSRSLHIARIAWFDWLVQAKHVLRRVVSMRIVTRLHALVSFP